MEENNTNQQADEQHLIEEIANNPKLFVDIFQSYSNSQSLQQQKYYLIIIQHIVDRNFKAILEMIKNVIIQSLAIDIQRLLAAIIYRLSLQVMLLEHDDYDDDDMIDFTEYLLLYQIYDNLFPFSFFLYVSSIQKEIFITKYQIILNEIEPEFFSIGLLYDDVEIKVLAVAIFTKTAHKVAPDFFDIYEKHFNEICQIAQDSIEFENNQFSNFWSTVIKFDNKISYDIFEIAYSLLPTENLQPEKQSSLLQYIIKKNEFIDKQDIEYIITKYFEVLRKTRELDEEPFIFRNMMQIDDDGRNSYEIFKREILSLLMNEEEEEENDDDDDNESAQSIGLFILSEFFNAYQKEAINDISEFIQIVFDVATNSIRNAFYALRLLEMSLKIFDKINVDDSMMAIDFLINIIVIYPTDEDIQYRALQACKNLPGNPLFFEKMIGIYDIIKPDSYAIYFSMLMNLHRPEICINMDKFEPFLTFLIKIFTESSEQISHYDDDKDDLEKFYNTFMINGSSSNLILYFWFLNPIQLNEYKNQAIENFFNLENFDLDDFDDRNYFSLADIQKDFTGIIMLMNESAKDIIQDHLTEIENSSRMDELQNFLCCNSDIPNECSSQFLTYIEEELQEILNRRASMDSIFSTFNDLVFPMSKWIYKVNYPQLHLNILRFLSALIATDKGWHYYNSISKICLRFVKPKRIRYNSSNNWYNGVVFFVRNSATQMVNIIKDLNKVELNNYFEGFTNLVLIFAYLNNDLGHDFLEHFLFSLYMKNQENNEFKMLNLFLNMIYLNYYNDSEIEIMLTVINESIRKHKKNYVDIEPSLFDLITNLSKINPEISPSYLTIAIEIFNETKNNISHISLAATCARFLLSTFNQNHQRYHDLLFPLIHDILTVFPVSEKYVTGRLWLEIKKFKEIFKDSMTIEIQKSLIGCLTKYLSYQKFTNIIFNVFDVPHGEIIQLYGELIESYISKFPDQTLKDILTELLPHQPTSIEFILSLNFQK